MCAALNAGTIWTLRYRVSRKILKNSKRLTLYYLKYRGHAKICVHARIHTRTHDMTEICTQEVRPV
jgi:hypothetical protein